MTAAKNQYVDINPEALYGVEAFRALNAAERRVIATYCKCRRCPEGQAIISYNDPSRDVFFIISGQVQATIYSLNGKQFVLQELSAGQMFGELAAIDGGRRAAYVVALGDALIASMTPGDFWHVLRSYPSVAEATLRRLTSMVRLLAGRIFEMGVLPVKQRIHAELLRLALQHLDGDNRAEINPSPTQIAIANHIGTAREGVGRELAHLQELGLIERRGRALVVNDVARLRQMVHQALGIRIGGQQSGQEVQT